MRKGKVLTGSSKQCVWQLGKTMGGAITDFPTVYLDLP
jgi:hypothetical protein